ncbi:hypothetical protein C8J57DRAFT_1534481 [Mycena rebaudengoi]|nr:hypothetical protein C8J57DRAFT_1534481 [Mycena rebaudengoi]
MGGLPDSLKIPDGSEKLSLPPNNLSATRLLECPLPPQRKSTAFDVMEIMVPPSVVVQGAWSLHLGSILLDPEAKSPRACARKQLRFWGAFGAIL